MSAPALEIPRHAMTQGHKPVMLHEVLEYLARMEWRVRLLNPGAARPAPFLVDKHHQRKHGPRAYYGQK